MAFVSLFEICHLYFRYTNPNKKDHRRKAWDHQEVGTSFHGNCMLKFRDSKRSQRGCKRKLMVNDNLFPYMLLFWTILFEIRSYFLFLIDFMSPCLFLLRWYVPQKNVKIAYVHRKIFSLRFKSLMLCLHIWRGFTCNNFAGKEIY